LIDLLSTDARLLGHCFQRDKAIDPTNRARGRHGSAVGGRQQDLYTLQSFARVQVSEQVLFARI